MNISHPSNNITFGKVYALAGTSEQINKLKTIMDNSNGDILCLEANKKSPNKLISFFKPKSAENIKNIALLVVGKKDIDKISQNAKGWRSFRDICKHVEKFADLTTVVKK